MRFFIAIGVFIVAAVLLGIGITQKILFSSPEFVTQSVTIEPTAHYVVINGKTLTANGDILNISASGATTNFVGYGRTEDVLAWIGDDNYDIVSYSPKLGELVMREPEKNQEQAGMTVVNSDAVVQTIISPAGSDLWLGEASSDTMATVPANLDSSMSVIIASDGLTDAPGKITLAWPLPSRVPYATTFVIIGGAMALIGLVLYLWALRHMRKQNGPRRGGKPPRPRGIDMIKPKSLTSAAPKGRRTLGRGSAFIALGMAGALAVGVSGCSPYQTGQGAQTPSPTPTDIQSVEGPPPAVTELQLGRILRNISTTVNKADKDLSAELAATRLVGPALEMRSANYAIRTADAAQAALPSLPASPITFDMPQATDTWPRIVNAVVQNEADPTVPTTGIVLVQNTPRENYHVEYLVTLQPDATVPTVAPATVGSPLVQPDSKLLLLSPEELSAAYGSVLTQGADSPYYGLFDLTGDTLVTQVGREYKEQKIASVSERASLEFSQNAGSGLPLALATLDSGAIVSVSLNEIETVKPTQAGASVSPEGQAKILSGITSSTVGVESTYGLQLAFYVPPLGSTDKIRLLGYSQGLIAAKGL